MSQFVVDGVSLFYEVRGDGEDRDTIFFLNGVMASTSSWYDLSALFVSAGFRVVLHDFKGQLRSDKPTGPYRFAEHARETVALMDHLGVKKAHLIGTSYGGEVGLKTAIDYAERVSSLSVICSVSETDALLDSFVDCWSEAARSEDPDHFYSVVVPSIYGRSYLKNNREAIVNRAQAMTKVPKDFYTGQLHLYETFKRDVTMTDELTRISCPTLIVSAEDDVVKPSRFSQIMRDAIEGSEWVVLPDCGHVAIFERDEELKSLLLGFVTKTRYARSRQQSTTEPHSS